MNCKSIRSARVISDSTLEIISKTLPVGSVIHVNQLGKTGSSFALRKASETNHWRRGQETQWFVLKKG